jgi:glyoxylase I family protein
MTTSSPVRGFSHVQLSVRDVETAQAWYTRVLGLELLQASEDGSYAALIHPPSRMVVVLSSYDGELGVRGALDHLAFGVPDGPALHAWAEQLTAWGIAHPGVADELGKPSLVLTDPDGNQIELVAPPGSW